MSRALTFEIVGNGSVLVPVRRVIGAGYAGRDAAAIRAHIDELAEAGVQAPPNIPMLFPFVPTLLSQETSTYALGPNTAPEVEYVLFSAEGDTFVTVGSDQTDTVVEAQSMELAKNCCVKSIAPNAWSLKDVRKHWDRLTLSLVCNEREMQGGALSNLLDPDSLIAFVKQIDGPEDDGRFIYSGTIAANGRFPKGDQRITISLRDPVLNRELRHSYTVTTMQPFFAGRPKS